MNDLAVKKVPFYGAELLAVQEKETGKIYAGINLILRDLGFDERQIEYRRNKWSSDKSISKGVQKFSYPSANRGMQEAYCIDIMKLPLALAKLEITPKMVKDMPELSAKLEEYQDKCADVLAAAFLPKEKEQQKRLTQEEMMRIQLGMLDEQSERIDGVEGRMDKLEFDIPLYGSEADELSNHVKRKGAAVLGGKQSEAYKDTEIRSKVYRDIYDQIKREFGIYDDTGRPKSYKALKRKYIADAHEFIDCYEAPTYLVELIEEANAQMNLDVA